MDHNGGVFLDNVPGITAAQLPAKVADGWMLLDVRTDEEWASGHIEGSTHIPMDQLLARMDEVDERVVSICHLGGRSARVTQYLSSVGREALNLDGGVQGWVDEGRPLAS